MEALATYLMKSSVWLTGFALVYALFLRNERFFTLNRIYLVSGMLFSMIFPLFTWHYTVLLPLVPSVEISEPQVQGIIIPEESFNPQYLLLLAYLAGIFYLSYRILRQTLPVFRIIRKSEKRLYSSAKLIRTDAYPASFSFFSFVFVNPSIDETETNEIVNHELEHIRQQHWIDLLLFEILRTMQWFNPVCWLYGHLIRQNHEYLADERALQRSSNPAIYRAALLNQMFGGPVILLANSFNYSLNKKRFNMMKQTISSPLRKLKLLMVLPLIAGVFYAFSTPEYQYTAGEANQNPQKSLYTITKDKIDIPFTIQYKKSDLEAVKADLEKLGIKIEYTSLAFSENGKLKQISASTKFPDGTGGSFTSKELTSTDHPGFKWEPNGSFGVYFQKTVTGKVISEDGKPLKGASILVVEGGIGTVTDANGNFKLEVPSDLPLAISYVGFETQKISPDFNKEMMISMKRKTFSIGIENKTSETRKEKPIDIKNSNSLIIVDGKEISKYELSRINPDKIESIDVLKGESAKAAYGEKGKEGVIKITMKTDDKTSVSEPIYVQTSSPIQFRNSDGSGTKPLLVKDGVIADNLDVNNIPPETIESINVLKGEKAIGKYGQKGSSGVVEIWTKKDNAKDVKPASEPIPFTITGNSSNSTDQANSVIEGFGKKPLVVIDGVISEIQSPDKVPSDSIASISILKGESATILYGDKGKNGVVLITSKRGASTSKKGTSEIKVVGYGNDKKENEANTGFQIQSSGTSGNEPKPLIVIDGVIAETQSMDKIDPETIESVSVIKNEVSTNKYGEKAKNGVIEITLKHPEEMAVIVESLPEFPGGLESLKKFVASSMEYPAVALEKGIQGQVMVGFVVSNTGEIINVKVKSGVDASLDKEAMRIVKSMPRWIPGKQNGEGVKVPYQIPINFSLPPKKISNEKLK